MRANIKEESVGLIIMYTITQLIKSPDNISYCGDATRNIRLKMSK